MPEPQEPKWPPCQRGSVDLICFKLWMQQWYFGARTESLVSINDPFCPLIALCTVIIQTCVTGCLHLDVKLLWLQKHLKCFYTEHLSWVVFRYWLRGSWILFIFSLILPLWFNILLLDHCLMMSLNLLCPTVYVVKYEYNKEVMNDYKVVSVLKLDCICHFDWLNLQTVPQSLPSSICPGFNPTNRTPVVVCSGYVDQGYS